VGLEGDMGIGVEVGGEKDNINRHFGFVCALWGWNITPIISVVSHTWKRGRDREESLRGF